MKFLSILLVGLFLSPSSHATLMLYTDRDEAQAVADNFTADTGIPVQIFKGNYNAIVVQLETDLAAGLTPDVIWSRDNFYIGDLVSKGWFQPMNSAFVQATVDPILRDPNNLWTAVTYRARTLIYDVNVDVSGINTYEDLGKPEWFKKLCIRDGKSYYTQSLVAYLIGLYGNAKATTIVQGWLNNQKSVKTDDMEIVNAIANGDCQVGIVNSYYLGQALEANGSLAVGLKMLNQTEGGVNVNGSGIGIAKTSVQIPEATQLIEYFLSEKIQALLIANSKNYPVNKLVAPAEAVKSWGDFIISSFTWSQAFPFMDQSRSLILNVNHP